MKIVITVTSDGNSKSSDKQLKSNSSGKWWKQW